MVPAGFIGLDGTRPFFGQVQAGMSMDIADEWSLDFSLPFKVGSDGERSAGARTGASKRF